MKDNFKYLVFFAFSIALSISQASNADLINKHVGKYAGSSPAWAKDQSTCEVLVSINSQKELQVIMIDSLGTRFVKRSQKDPSVFEATILKSWSYPKTKVSQISRRGGLSENGFSHSIRKTTLSDESSWYLDAEKLDRPGLGSVRIVYRKSKRWQTYNATLEYVGDHTGCYNLYKVQ